MRGLVKGGKKRWVAARGALLFQGAASVGKENARAGHPADLDTSGFAFWGRKVKLEVWM